MDGQYDYIRMSTPELMGEFMTKDLDRNFENYSIESRGFLSKNILKKDGQVFNFNGPLTIYSHKGEYVLWIRNGLVVDMITNYKKEEEGFVGKKPWYKFDEAVLLPTEQKTCVGTETTIMSGNINSGLITDHVLDVKDNFGECIKCGEPPEKHLLTSLRTPLKKKYNL